jgi:hypothetical protein
LPKGKNPNRPPAIKSLAGIKQIISHARGFHLANLSHSKAICLAIFGHR